MRATFFGVRGSCPCSSEQHRRYGGNTSCVYVDIEGDPPLILDLGTGLRPLGHYLEAGSHDTGGASEPFVGTALLTHLHWDHLIGLPFFRPIQRPGARLEVHGPVQDDGSLHDVIDRVVQPPFFPVQVKELAGAVEFCEVDEGDFAVGSAKVLAREVPHLGRTLGYRIEAEGASIAYISDHQAPPSTGVVPAGVLELADGVDLLIHDAQYTERQFAERSEWGHSTVSFALRVAVESGARRLALFHHDPSHTDDEIDQIAQAAARCAQASRLQDVFGAAEGDCIEL